MKTWYAISMKFILSRGRISSLLERHTSIKADDYIDAVCQVSEAVRIQKRMIQKAAKSKKTTVRIETVEADACPIGPSLRQHGVIFSTLTFADGRKDQLLRRLAAGGWKLVRPAIGTEEIVEALLNFRRNSPKRKARTKRR